MRLISRVRLLFLLSIVALAPGAFADHQVADCPLALVGSSGPASPFTLSPHGVFRNGTVVYSLRGQTLTTFDINDVGEIRIAREDFLPTLSGRENTGGVAYSAGFLYVSTEAGLEIFDLRNTRSGGTAPALVSRTRGLHYDRLTVSGNLVAGVYSARNLPCIPDGVPLSNCRNSIDIYSVTNMNAPALVSRIQSDFPFLGFSDVVFANGFLYSTGIGGTFAFSLSNPSFPAVVEVNPTQGEFIFSDGRTFLGVGQQRLIGIFRLGPSSAINYFSVFTIPTILDRSNRIVFGRDAFFDNTRLITLINENDPLTGNPARTIAFDVFDFTVPYFDGSSDRIYENVSFTSPDEVKHNPIAVGPYIYVVGEVSGTQTYGACGQVIGKIEFDTLEQLPCGGAELRGWVTGQTRVTQVEIFLDGSSLGRATIGRIRDDVRGATTPVNAWRIAVNLDQVPRGQRTIRAVGTDANGNVRQFATRSIFFNGPGGNCTTRRRGVVTK